jgi:hypothetical protein
VSSVVDIDFDAINGCNVAFDAHGTLYKWAWGEIPVQTKNCINCFLDEGVIRATAIASNMLHPAVAYGLRMIGPLREAAKAIQAVPLPLYGDEQKPSPAGLRKMILKLDWDPDESVYVDDQLMGIRAAKEAGFRTTILINEPIGWEPPWIRHKRAGAEAKLRGILRLSQVNSDQRSQFTAALIFFTKMKNQAHVQPDFSIL